MKLSFFIVLKLYLLLLTSPVFSAIPVTIDESLESRSIGLYLEYLEDKDDSLSIEDIAQKRHEVQWVKSKKESPAFGFTQSVYWARFIIKNDTDKDIQFYLENASPQMDRIRLYIPQNRSYKIIQTGDSMLFSERPVEYRTFVFPLKLQAKSKALYYMSNKIDGPLSLSLKIWSPGTFKKSVSNEDRLLMLFYGTILVMTVYNFILFFFIRRREYLYYSIFVIFVLLFWMVWDGTAFQYLWPDSPWWSSFCAPLFLNLHMLFIMLFCIEFVGWKTLKEQKIYLKRLYFFTMVIVYSFIPAILLCFFLPLFLSILISAAFAGIVMVYVGITGLVLIIKEKSRPALLGLIATSVVILGALSYLLKEFAILPVNLLTQWSTYIGIVLMVILSSIALGDSINVMRKDIEKGERKYRSLVESSKDIIFSLDENFNFINLNSAVTNHLGYEPEDVVGKNFLDFIHEAWRENQELARTIAKEHLDELERTNESVIFRTDLKPRHFHEPKEFSIKLEPADPTGGIEKIIGKASLITDDIILNFMENEKRTYLVDNYLSNAELVSNRLTRNLGKFLRQSELICVRIGLKEILINAIEHGNLAIDFQKKSKAMKDGNYMALIEKRQKDPRYKDRKVLVKYYLTNRSAKYNITDEGDGFNHEEIIGTSSDMARNDLLFHGRGIGLAMNIFDEVVYNAKGNQVMLVKYFKKS